jgi:hypothetical protein
MPSTTNLEEEEIVDAPGNVGHVPMPEQVKRPNPWMVMMMMMMMVMVMVMTMMMMMMKSNTLDMEQVKKILLACGGC